MREKECVGEVLVRIRRQCVLVIGWFFLFILCLSETAVFAGKYKDSNPDDYVTEHFDVTVEFDRSHTASVTEKIQVDFRKKHHGIIRNIPVAADGTYEIKNLYADDAPYTVEKSDHNMVIRIGDEDRYLKGSQTYIIRYQLEYYEDADQKADFLAQNMLPAEWETSIRNSVLTLIMPEKIDAGRMAGAYGQCRMAAFHQQVVRKTGGWEAGV